MRFRILPALAIFLGLTATTALTQEKSPQGAPSVIERSKLDKRIVDSVYEATKLGTEAYNKGNYEFCFGLYVGSLMSLQPLLDQRPELAKSVKDKMDRAKTMDIINGAFELRKALDEIQNDIAPPGGKIEKKTDVTPAKVELKKTLWDRLGGLGGAKQLVSNVLLRAIEDPKLKRVSEAKKLDIKSMGELQQTMIEYISSISGGTLKFTVKDIKAGFAGLKITDEEFNTFTAIVEAQLKKNLELTPTDIKDFMASLESLRKDIVEVKTKN